ncbi:microtubule-associated proteins 1A/1B light chain 3C-like isoform X2 [Anthonomus grandis grandis]|uniref:microtubule-associated proteins 1A/1B light chain 3C-like isoform X2 n=1 Tax=Anthonomus grandis grandis TaxID=2921223 RepID=UPI0021651C71|nr:microtubule-associated proteins 1A/1B light chain 3C-like isoform X2 [Anthonomus grandis grandis]
MKGHKKMMVMEMKIAELSKLGAKEIRKEEVMAIRNRFPNKIPVIVQKYWKDNQLPQLDKSKFLVPQDITMSQFQTIIRNRMRMNQNQALYLLVNDRSMLSLSLTLGEVYSEHAGPNGFLYVTYASQEVFGGKCISLPNNIKARISKINKTEREES